jgi:uncharacterized DUF497 family protein
MRITFDPAKNEHNIQERGISFELAADFDFETAIYAEDVRKDYGEVRIRALGFIGTGFMRLYSRCAERHCESSA